MANIFNLQSVDLEGIINSTAYAVKARYVESPVVRLVIVPREENAPVPTNYETLMAETSAVERDHHIIDSDSIEQYMRDRNITRGPLVERGNNEI